MGADGNGERGPRWGKLAQYLLLTTKGRLSSGKEQTPIFRSRGSLSLLQLIGDFLHLGQANTSRCESLRVSNRCKHHPGVHV